MVVTDALGDFTPHGLRRTGSVMDARKDDPPADQRPTSPAVSSARPDPFAGSDPFAKLGDTLRRWYDLSTPDIMM